VPAISAFYGIIVRMFFNEHVPPHFHAEYAEFKIEIEIETLRVMRGGLPRRAQALVLEWAALHRDELMADWALCWQHQQPQQIQPLE